ncbi:hypothetical protein BJ973_007842 [Actinoplanes tereljensis]|uniref:DUF4097 domain-containing protein n=1 Tax=Paractinoplanes tereljensis TaxID=571912 RepID=A0A919TV44_9ACTN|nr:DUF4097 family beta strand repeat-containing protein [Actinoplanes tereljensis]GIF24363.1 hypothetical protein Ate02nite_70930 [Actinoplanes tereljensis]
MPKFETPEPISVTLDYAVGNVRIAASDRTDTVVEVRPSHESDESDVQAARETRVDYSNGTLQVTGPKRLFDFSKKTRAVEVTIELPAGSRLDAHLQMGEVRTTGRLGDSKIKTTGNILLERTGPLRLHTGYGHVTIDAVTGDADISTGSGKIQVGEVTGTVAVKNANGDTLIDAATGDVRVRNSNGNIEVDRAGAGVDAKTSNGNIRLGEVIRGAITLATAAGGLDVGIAAGTAAWLELNTGFGNVLNQLENTTRPDETASTVEVRGRTGYGDIAIHRS